MPATLIQKEDHKYIQIAEDIEKLIHGEVLKIGERLPSVRVLSEEKGISMGTAFQAYYLLEGKGLIEARPKSGYFVRFNNKRFPGIPSMSENEPQVQNVSIEEMIAQVYQNIASKDVINFSIAVPSIDLLPAAKLNKSVIHALRSSADHCLKYEETQGNIELRKQIAKLSFSWGGKCSPADVVITSGCMDALALCLKAVTKPGDAVAIETPTYFGILQLMESLSLKAVEIQVDSETGVDLEQVETCIKKFQVKACLFTPSFNNPIGSCMPDENKKKLVQIITKYKVPLIEDDIYGELYFGKSRPKTCKTYDTEGWVLYCSSISKSLAPGYRIGWCIPGRFIDKVKHLKMTYSISSPAITQSAIAHFLSIGRYEYHLKNLRKALHTQCLRYMQGIIEYFPDDIKISRPAGGFIFWIELNKKINSFQLFRQAMKYNISITPGQIFSLNGSYSNYIRISFGNRYDNNSEYGLKIVGQLIKKAR
jgi:DNA-binding transcriptional MocR family regulator